MYKLCQLTRQNIYLQGLRSQLRNQLLATELSIFVSKEVKKHLENLISETNEFEMFENQRQLVSYAGYDVVQNQSGKQEGKTRISKRGNNRIRRALHMLALQVVKYEQKPFSDLYNRVFERTKIKMNRTADAELYCCPTKTTHNHV